MSIKVDEEVKGRIEISLGRVIKNLGKVDGIILSYGGRTISSLSELPLPDDRLSYLSNIIMKSGRRVSREIGIGELEKVIIFGEKSNIVAAPVTAKGKLASLTVISKPELEAGLLLLEMRRTIDEIKVNMGELELPDIGEVESVEEAVMEKALEEKETYGAPAPQDPRWIEWNSIKNKIPYFRNEREKEAVLKGVEGDTLKVLEKVDGVKTCNEIMRETDLPWDTVNDVIVMYERTKYLALK